MKAFHQINALINANLDNPNEDIYFGHFNYSEFDEEDETELLTWDSLGETLCEKKIGNKFFSFDLILQD